MTAKGNRTMRAKGFTLVEVMVAATIVVVLAGIAVHASRGAVRQAQMSASVSNLRQLASANAGYVADHGTYAPATDQRNQVRWHGARSSGSAPFDPREGYLSPYLGGSRRIGMCPGLVDHLEGDESWEDGSGGYGYNAIYVGGTPENPFQPSRPSRIRHPARTLMFATTAFARGDGLQEYPFAEPRFWVDPNGNPGGPLQPSVHFRFGGRALICWCDGHVSAERMNESSEINYYGGDNEKQQIGFPGPEKNNGWWNPDK